MPVPIRPRWSRCLLVLVLAAACAPAGSAPRTGAQHNLVTHLELQRAGDVSLYDALSQIRPAFLGPRTVAGATVAAPPLQVYVGELQMMEGVTHLREIMAKNVKEVRFLEPQQANARYGGNNSGGALIITML